MEKMATLKIWFFSLKAIKMKIIFLTLLAFCFSLVTYSQIDTVKNEVPQSFEDYKKAEVQRFSELF